MLVTFECSVYPTITMFDKDASELILLMEQNGAIPGAVDADVVPDALDKLISVVYDETQAAKIRNDIALKQDDDIYIGVDKRVRTLIQLLQAASKEKVSVEWYQFNDII